MLRNFFSRLDVKWNLLIVPLFVGGFLIMLRAWGQIPSIMTYVFEIGAKSVTVLIAVALTHAVTKGLRWNLDNDQRDDLVVEAEAGRLGAVFLLVLELVSVMAVLITFIWALTVWQPS